MNKTKLCRAGIHQYESKGRGCPECTFSRKKNWARKNAEKINARALTRNSANKEHIQEYRASWYQRNRNEVRAKTKKRLKDNPDIAKGWGLRVYYRHLKLTGVEALQEFNKKKLAQNNVCYICKQPETSTYKGKIRELSLDHNHDTFEIRKLLCTNCNAAVGQIHENPTKGIEVSRYVFEHNNPGKLFEDFLLEYLTASSKDREST